MKKCRFTEEQIIAILKQALAGAKPADPCRKHGITETTFYRWKAKFGDMEVSDAKRFKKLENENRRLMRLVPDLTLDKQALRDVVCRKCKARRSTRGRSLRPGKVRHERAPVIIAVDAAPHDVPV